MVNDLVDWIAGVFWYSFAFEISFSIKALRDSLGQNSILCLLYWQDIACGELAPLVALVDITFKK